IDLARRQIAAFDAAVAQGEGVAVVDGRIIENLHIVTAKRLLAKARASQPFERQALWTAAQIAMQVGQLRLAETQLRQWLVQYPRDTEQALFIARRWIDDPGELIDRVLPPGPLFLQQAMAVARARRDRQLAESVWQRLDPKPGLDEDAFLDYVQLLLDAGDAKGAFELWTRREPQLHSGVVNGSFSRELGRDTALNWRSRAPAGVRIERDFEESESAPASLKIEFNGKENIHLAAPWILLPADAGVRYRLAGAWRAERLSTRSLPYLLVTAAGGLRETLKVPSPDFDWQPFQLELRVPEDADLLRLELRRDRTQAFDRNIDGRLWLDSISLSPIDGPRPEPPITPALTAGQR
ncbi:MAG: hypothetical protein RQ826_11695, partial [Xanthomonadales bacterium]|nr:hypothetical protein [Xanthomonadales bacterium]